MKALECAKTEYKILLTLLRNILEAHLCLLKQTEYNTFLLPPTFPWSITKLILQARRMRVVDIFNTLYWPQRGSYKPCSYKKSFKGARLNPVIFLHVFILTGFLKPII